VGNIELRLVGKKAAAEEKKKPQGKPNGFDFGTVEGADPVFKPVSR